MVLPLLVLSLVLLWRTSIVQNRGVPLSMLVLPWRHQREHQRGHQRGHPPAGATWATGGPQDCSYRETKVWLLLAMIRFAGILARASSLRVAGPQRRTAAASCSRARGMDQSRIRSKRRDRFERGGRAVKSSSGSDHSAQADLTTARTILGRSLNKLESEHERD